jgi:hypothetical protein
MKTRWRLVYYLLINVFVSALVTGLIIYFYDQIHRNDCNTSLPSTTALSTGVNDVNVNIVSVVGTGTLSNEQIVIRNDGSQPLILTGWYLKNSKGETYTFRQLTIYPGAKILVHTKSGTDILPDLYWGRSAPAWISGELAALYDVQNIARAFYRIP